MPRSKPPLTAGLGRASHRDASQATHSNSLSARQLEDQRVISKTTCKTAWLLTQKAPRSIVDRSARPLPIDELEADA
jgi:hypothetical protein